MDEGDETGVSGEHEETRWVEESGDPETGLATGDQPFVLKEVETSRRRNNRSTPTFPGTDEWDVLQVT